MVLRFLLSMFARNGADPLTRMSDMLANNIAFQRFVVRMNQKVAGGRWNHVELPKDLEHDSDEEQESTIKEVLDAVKETWEDETGFRKRR